MEKSPDAFRTISEVSEWLDTPAHVLRFWESRFTQIKPVKRAGGRRYYRPADMMLLGGIKKLLHDEGMTIRGVQKILRDQGIKHVSALSQSLEDDSIPGEKTAEAPMAQDVDAPAANVVPLKPAEPVTEAPKEVVQEPAEPEAKEAGPAPKEPVAAPEPEVAAAPEISEPELPLSSAAPAPLGTDLPATDPADDALPLAATPLCAQLRNRATRRNLRENHAVAIAHTLPRLKALRDRLSDAG